MRRVFVASALVLIVAALAGLLFTAARADGKPCPLTKAGVCQLHGKVKFVTAFPKYKIKFVTAFPDIKVKNVTAFPDKPGEWQVVEAFPDFTVQVVDAFPDFTVQYVEAFPGCN
jgi:hypothetical protein